MLQYVQNGFYYAGALFTIPEGMCLETEPASTSENSLELVAPDSSFRINVGFYESDDQTTADFLQDVFETDDVFTEQLHDVCVGGFAGSAASYHSKTNPRYRHEEYVLRIRSGVVLNFWFCIIEPGKTFNQKFYDDVKQKFLQGIRAV